MTIHFQFPDKDLESGAPTTIVRNNDKLEIYDYPGDYAKLFKDRRKASGQGGKGRAAHWSTLRMQREEAAYEEAYGTSNVRTFSQRLHVHAEGSFQGGL